ncbi:hypothetical protein [Pseudomonas sp. McL0111]|uniref:hypothetical protein n=1 Tax=Pseudomonas sp. McL0111 TaxID=3457357 RepID=UPI00403E5F49
MNKITARQLQSCALLCLISATLALTAGCSSKRYSSAGSNCYAKAVPTSGEGGLAWGDTLSMARKKSMDNCMRYATRSGGTPNTCQVVLAQCKR